jgi:HAD superfamily hydrolase (TIGR01509 family)
LIPVENPEAQTVRWDQVNGVLFDLDGTLYSQPRLRLLMVKEMVLYFAAHPLQIGQLRVLFHFRRLRERHGFRGGNIGHGQYEVTATALGVTEEYVREAVDRWILREPLKHLAACKFKHVDPVFARLKAGGKGIAIVSDYPVREKMEWLGLEADVAVCATDPDVDCFKPDPKGFLVAAAKLGLAPHECLVVGDRDEKDGEAARAAGMVFLHSTLLGMESSRM